MSMPDEIRNRIKAHHGERLFYLPPRYPGDPTIRTVFVSQEVKDAVVPPWPKNWEGLRCSEFRGTLDAFTRGDTISVAERPYDKPSDAFLARVDPVGDEIWDIRSISPNPGIRCLGGFGGKDLFIALTWDYRESFDWDYEIEHCKSNWDALFNPLPRFQKASLDEYLTNYYAF